MIKIKIKDLENKTKKTVSLENFIEQMNLSSELRDFNDDDVCFEIIEDKKNPDAEKLEKLQKKYKQLAEKHRKDRQAEYPRRNQDRQKVQRMHDILTTVIDRMYQYIPDEDLCEIELELEKIIKNA